MQSEFVNEIFPEYNPTHPEYDLDNPPMQPPKPGENFRNL